MSAVADAQAAASSSRAAGSFTRRVSSRRPRDVAMTGMTGRRRALVRASSRLPRDETAAFSEIVRTSATTVSRERTSTRVTHDARSRRDALGRFAASIAGFLTFESTTALTAPPASFAMFNKDLDVPIEDPIQAIAVIYAVRACIGDVLAQIELFSTTCPAPTFPCDLSQLNTKASTRISGPLARALPTLSEAYGADPYAVQDILQSVTQTESMLKSNNARVKVDFEGPKTYLELVDSSIVAFLEEVPAEKVAEGKALYDACDLNVDATVPGSLECRLGRAVAQNARPSGGIG